MTTQELIPYSAWQQIPFVIAIVVLIYIILVWMGKQNQEARDDNSKRESEQRVENSKQAMQWQNFISEIEQQWRDFSNTQRVENNMYMNEMRNSLNDLTAVTQALVSEVKEMRADTNIFFKDFHTHDKQAQEILDVVKNSDGVVRSGSRKPKDPNA